MVIAGCTADSTPSASPHVTPSAAPTVAASVSPDATPTATPEPPLSLAPPLSQDRVTGGAAPPPPPQWRPERKGRSLLLVKIGLSAILPVVGFGARLALRQSRGDDVPVRRATSASVFAGECVSIMGSRIETVGCDEPHTGRVRAIVDDSSGTCPTSTIDSIVVSSDPTKRLCIAPD